MKRVAHRLVLALVAACVLVSAASAREATVQDEQLLEVGFFGATKALLMAPEQPKALALLFAGGDGDLRLSGSTGLVVLGPLQANFLIRTRRMWFENDIAILAIDAPGGRPMTALNRLSALGQVETLLAAARKAAPALEGVPVWAVGTSAGTISVAGLVASAPQLIDGAIFTSSVTRPQGAPGVWSDGHPRGVASMAVGKFSKPVLVVSHKEDRCPSTPAADADMLAAAFTASTRRQAVVVDALSNPNGDPCGPFSPHGFDEMDREVVNLLVEFVLRAP